MTWKSQFHFFKTCLLFEADLRIKITQLKKKDKWSKMKNEVSETDMKAYHFHLSLHYVGKRSRMQKKKYF